MGAHAARDLRLQWKYFAGSAPARNSSPVVAAQAIEISADAINDSLTCLSPRTVSAHRTAPLEPALARSRAVQSALRSAVIEALETDAAIRPCETAILQCAASSKRHRGTLRPPVSRQVSNHARSGSPTGRHWRRKAESDPNDSRPNRIHRSFSLRCGS